MRLSKEADYPFGMVSLPKFVSSESCNSS